MLIMTMLLLGLDRQSQCPELHLPRAPVKINHKYLNFTSANRNHTEIPHCFVQSERPDGDVLQEMWLIPKRKTKTDNVDTKIPRVDTLNPV